MQHSRDTYLLHWWVLMRCKALSPLMVRYDIMATHTERVTIAHQLLSFAIIGPMVTL